MRMGKPNKKPRYAKKSIPPNTKPKYSSPNLVVGQVSSNLIASIYSPLLTEIANEVLERYADDMLQYNDAIKAAQEEAKNNETNDTEEQVEVDMDGSTTSIKQQRAENIVLPPPPRRPLFRSQHVIDEYEQMLQETSDHFTTKTNEWKIHVNAAKFERRLDEKYGIFRPFITEHPEIEQFIRSVQRKYAMGYFSPFRQNHPPILNKTTTIILLFMLQRNNVKWEILVLAALFLLVGLQPWALVLIVALGHFQVEKRKQRPLGNMQTTIEVGEPYYYNHNRSTNESKTNTTQDDQENDENARKIAFLHKPVGTPLGSDDESINGAAYDALLLGSGPATLYTGALLARAGRKVLVLSNRTDASGCLTLQQDGAAAAKKTAAQKFATIPFDVDATNVAHITKVQQTLAPALCTSTDLQGGVRFAQIGTQADGYAFEILSIPGMGSGSSSASSVVVGDNNVVDIPFVLRASGQPLALMEDAATFLNDGWPTDEGEIGNSTSGSYLAVCKAIDQSSRQYYLSKILPESVNGLRNKSTYQESSIRYAASFLDKYLPLNAHVRSLMAGIGMKGENIQPGSTSMAPHVTNICASFSGEGMHYPIGGPRALCHALASVIEQCGGRIVTGVSVKELVFEEQKQPPDKEEEEKKEAVKDDDDKDKETKEKEHPAPHCIGVKLTNDQLVILPHDDAAVEDSKSDGALSPAVISMDGFIYTFIRYLPDAIRSKHKVPRGLPALTERRPVFKILFVLKGSAQDLNVTGADFYRLPGAALARDEIDVNTGAVKLGVIGGSDAEEEEDEDEKPRRDKTSKAVDDTKIDNSIDVTGLVKKKKTKKVKFDSGASWIHISFPSAKDPSFSSCYDEDVTTCVVTVEADDDFVKMFDSKPKLYVILKEKPTGELERLLERVTKDLLDLFPQLSGKIEHSEVRGPFAQGLSHNPERYAVKGVRPESPYPGLFVGGSDLTVGDSFDNSIGGGWLAANAVMGYSALDYLFLEKNITTDLDRFLECPYCDDEKEDLAVPYTPKVVPAEEPAKEESEKDEVSTPDSAISVPTSD